VHQSKLNDFRSSVLREWRVVCWKGKWQRGRESRKGLDSTRRPPMSPTSPSPTAGQAGDDDVEETNDGTDDGLEDSSDAVDDGHQAGTDGAENALNA